MTTATIFAPILSSVYMIKSGDNIIIGLPLPIPNLVDASGFPSFFKIWVQQYKILLYIVYRSEVVDVEQSFTVFLHWKAAVGRSNWLRRWSLFAWLHFSIFPRRASAPLAHARGRRANMGLPFILANEWHCFQLSSKHVIELAYILLRPSVSQYVTSRQIRQILVNSTHEYVFNDRFCQS